MTILLILFLYSPTTQPIKSYPCPIRANEGSQNNCHNNSRYISHNDIDAVSAIERLLECYKCYKADDTHITFGATTTTSDNSTNGALMRR